LPPALRPCPAVGHLRNAVAGEQVLEDQLVHADRRGLNVGAGVGDAEDLEQTLHAAVLSPWAVEHREGDVAIQQPSGRREAHRGALGAPAPLTADGHLNRLATRLPEAAA